MARYLLNSSDEEKSAWEAAAKEQGITLAKFLRNAANASLKTHALRQDVKATVGGQPFEAQPWAVTPDWKR